MMHIKKLSIDKSAKDRS